MDRYRDRYRVSRAKSDLVDALVVRTAVGVAGAALLLAIVLLALAVYYFFVVERAQRSTILGSQNGTRNSTSNGH